MLFGMSRALSPTPPWNVRLNVGGTNTEFEYQNPRVPQYCNFRKLASAAHVSSAALIQRVSVPWVAGGGEGWRMCFGLVFTYPL